MKYLLLSLCLCCLLPAGWAGERVLEFAGDEIGIETHPAQGERLLLWLPSEFGLSPRQRPTAEGLAKLGIEVWMPDLHAAFFIAPGRYSLNEIDPQLLVALIEDALGSGKQVFILSQGRVSALALQAVRRYQQSGKPTARLRGLLAFSPRLYLRTPQGGEAAQFLPIASASNLPLYLLQPQAAGTFWRIGRIAEVLGSGGSPVFIHTLPQVGDGFHLRPEFTPAEAAMTGRLPPILAHAMSQLDDFGGVPAQAAAMLGEETAPQANSGSALLKPYPGERQAPSLALPMLDGAQLDLRDLQGKVVLVNFWATWCPPCVEEIPSLQRLYRATRAQGLEILAVDVGETPQQMHDFLADKPIDFPVLMDVDGSALKTWGVHAFPTTLVLDRTHRIRYAVFGAFDWNSAEVRAAIAPLLAE